MRKFKGKDNINTLLNIDTIFAEHEGRVMPIIITILLVALPPLAWLFFLQGTPVKFWYVLVFDIFWGGYWGLYIIGKYPQKKRFFLQQREDEYASADELIHISNVHDDGLIEYDNGSVAVLVTGYLKGYLTEDKLSVDMEHFMDELDNWQWDYFLHNTIDELLCADKLPLLKRYTDKDVIKERIEFYDYQDEWSRNHTAMYCITFLVTAPRYDFRKLQSHMEELVSSELALMFNQLHLADYNEVGELLNRDICGFVNITRMLLKKYNNQEFFGSKVLWYDNNIPEKEAPKRDTSNLEERRVQ